MTIQDTFIPEFEARFPTSVDMLEPQSPLLETMRHMQIEPTVKLHNIIGVSHLVSLDGLSDGIVSARSASHPSCQSVLLVDNPHAQVHRAQETSAEILRILPEHCDSNNVNTPNSVLPQQPKEIGVPKLSIPQTRTTSFH